MGAKISECGQYRYRLWRFLDEDNPKRVVFVMLNPSTADEEQDDPTIRRCLGFAEEWGMGRLDVVNLYPLRATDPKELKAHDTPEGPNGGAGNLQQIIGTVIGADLVVAAWGTHAKDEAHVARVCRGIQQHAELQVLGFTKGKQPRHPLFVKKGTALKPWNGPVAA